MNEKTYENTLKNYQIKNNYLKYIIKIKYLRT